MFSCNSKNISIRDSVSVMKAVCLSLALVLNCGPVRDYEKRRMWFSNNTSPKDVAFPGCKTHCDGVHTHIHTEMEVLLVPDSTDVGV